MGEALHVWGQGACGKSLTLLLNIAVVKKQNSQNKFKDLIGFIKHFINWAPYYLTSREMFRAAVQKWKVFIGRMVGQELLAKEEKG